MKTTFENKNKGFKKAFQRKIPCYYNEETHEIKGRNWFYDQLVGINIFIDFEILGIVELPILVKIDDEDE